MNDKRERPSPAGLPVNGPALVETGPDRDAVGLVHRVRRPADAGPHPTVVMLHGLFGDEDVMWIFEKTVPDPWLKVAPRAPHAAGSGFSWYPHPPEHTWPRWDAFQKPAAQLVQLIRALPDVYNADPEQIYLMGFSQGAALSYVTAVLHPELISGIAGLVGFMPAGIEKHLPAAPLLHMPVFIAVGTEDKTVPPALGRRSGELAQEAGAWLEYREYETGHKLDAAGMRKVTSWWQERDEEG